MVENGDAEHGGGTEGTSAPRRLRLVQVQPGPETPDEALESFVRAARRDMVRLLRGLARVGRSPASFPDEVLTRLAHADAVTARFLLADHVSEPDKVREAASTMRTLEQWIVRRLSVRDLAAVREGEMVVRVEDAELSKPLLQADFLPEDGTPEAGLPLPGASPLSLRAGLASLPDHELMLVCRRLGVLALGLEDSGEGPAVSSSDSRTRAERAVSRTLADGHLLGILVATLPVEAHRLLAALVRGEVDERGARLLAVQAPEVTAGQGAFQTPVALLRTCGLAYCSGPRGRERVWVPVELQRRLDGVLRAFGA